MNTPAERIRGARESREWDFEAVAAAAGLSYDWYWDVEWNPSEARENISLAQLGVVTRLLALDPLYALEGTPLPAATRTLAELVEAIQQEQKRRSLSLQQLGDWLGWEVAAVLEDPFELSHYPASALRDICEALGFDWREFLAAATAAEPGAAADEAPRV